MITFDVDLPFSKSISNRLLILRALSNPSFSIEGLSDSTDTERLRAILSSDSSLIDAGDGGTTFRFLLPLLSFRKGEFVLTGTERMKKRPIRELVDALREIGAVIDYLEEDGFPPLRICGGELKGGSLSVDVSRSSQFASALLLIAPFMKNGLRLHLTGSLVSESYIELTLKVMQQLGFTSRRNDREVLIPYQQLECPSMAVERDWSSAAFWYLLVATQRDVSINLTGLSFTGVQGDEQLADYFSELGIATNASEQGVMLSARQDYKVCKSLLFDLKSTPDIAPALMSACYSLKQPARFTGVSHLRYKESDRLQVLGDVFSKGGAKVSISDDELELQEFPTDFLPVTVRPENDHRIAMSFGVLAAAGLPFQIMNPEVVRKSYPQFWSQLAKFGFNVPIISSTT